MVNYTFASHSIALAGIKIRFQRNVRTPLSYCLCLLFQYSYMWMTNTASACLSPSHDVIVFILFSIVVAVLVVVVAVEIYNCNQHELDCSTLHHDQKQKSIKAICNCHFLICLNFTVLDFINFHTLYTNDHFLYAFSAYSYESCTAKHLPSIT